MALTRNTATSDVAAAVATKQVVSNVGIGRQTFAQIPTVLEMPNLVQVQVESFNWFVREGLRELLEERAQVSIGQALAQFPAEQGLGSVVGYVALGVKHGELTSDVESVSWLANDEVQRRAKVPAIYFVRERLHELAD